MTTHRAPLDLDFSHLQPMDSRFTDEMFDLPAETFTVAGFYDQWPIGEAVTIDLLGDGSEVYEAVVTATSIDDESTTWSLQVKP